MGSRICPRLRREPECASSRSGLGCCERGWATRVRWSLRRCSPRKSRTRRCACGSRSAPPFPPDPHTRAHTAAREHRRDLNRTLEEKDMHPAFMAELVRARSEEQQHRAATVRMARREASAATAPSSAPPCAEGGARAHRAAVHPRCCSGTGSGPKTGRRSDRAGCGAVLSAPTAGRPARPIAGCTGSCRRAVRRRRSLWG